jgi:hypothetical protein
VETVEVFKIEKAGDDFILLRNESRAVQITFEDGYMGTKEENAQFFCHLVGKPAAIPIDGGPLFIGVDIWYEQLSGMAQTMPLPFDIASVDRL